MARVRKRGAKFIAEVRRAGHAPRSKTFDSKNEAMLWALETERDLGKAPAGPSRTLRQAFERYEKEVSPKKRGFRWEEIRLRKLGRDDIADISLATLRRQDLQAWIDRQTVSAGSILRELNLIQSVLREARRWGWMSHEVTRDLVKPTNPAPRDRRISAREIAAIIAALGYVDGQPVTSSRQRTAVAFLLCLETALRQGEVFGLTWRDVRLEARTVALPMTKNGYSREVPLTTRAVALLEMLGPEAEGPVIGCSQAKAGQLFRAAVKSCKLQDLHFHDTRHEAVTRLAKFYPNVLDLARIVGHRDVRSLMIYYNATASELAQLLP